MIEAWDAAEKAKKAAEEAAEEARKAKGNTGAKSVFHAVDVNVIRAQPPLTLPSTRWLRGTSSAAGTIWL